MAFKLKIRFRFFKWWANRFQRRRRCQYLRVLRLPGTIHRLALGLALGLAAGLLPIVPFQTACAFILCFIFRGNFIASLPTIQITNPITIPAFYFLFFQIGRLVSPYGREATLPPVAELMSLPASELLLSFKDVFWAMMFGGAVLAAIFAPILYILTRLYLDKLRRYEHRKIRLRRVVSSKNS